MGLEFWPAGKGPHETYRNQMGWQDFGPYGMGLGIRPCEIGRMGLKFVMNLGDVGLKWKPKSSHLGLGWGWKHMAPEFGP